jgi:hypothetical protein
MILLRVAINSRVLSDFCATPLFDRFQPDGASRGYRLIVRAAKNAPNKSRRQASSTAGSYAIRAKIAEVFLQQ